MTEVILHGLAGKKFKNYNKFFNINKPMDCIEAMDANNPGFKKFFTTSSIKNMQYEMIVDGNALQKSNQAIKKKQIQRIEIVPCITGNDPASLSVFVGTLILGLVFAGIQYLMTPIPEREPKGSISRLGARSFFFANRENLAEQFTPVPLGYGSLRVGSKIIQSVIEPVDLSSLESDFSSSTSTSAGGGSNVVSEAGGGGGGGY